MTWERARGGLLGGLVGLAPLLLVFLATKFGFLTDDSGSLATFLALLITIGLSGTVAGYSGIHTRRRRREAKAAIGGFSGIIAALVFALALVGYFVVNYLRSAPLRVYYRETLQLPRIGFVILLMGAVIVIVAMVVAQLTAPSLPPPRQTRRLTGEIPAQRPGSVPTRGPSSVPTLGRGSVPMPPRSSLPSRSPAPSRPRAPYPPSRGS